MLKISEINTKKQFYEMRNRWNQTLNNSKDNNIFLTWEKMAPSVNQLGKDSTIKILCATDGVELVGIAPLRKTHKNLRGNSGYSFIEPLTNGDTDYAGLILVKQEVNCIRQFLQYLYSQKDWDFMVFPDLPQASQTLELLKHTFSGLPRFEVEKGIICPYIEIPNSKERLLANLSVKHRKNLQRRLRKLEKEHGKVELKQYYELGSLEQTMEILFELHQKRWILKNKPGRFDNQKARDISLQTAKYFAEKGWLRFYFLTVNNRPVAAELNLEYLGKMYGHLSCFDPDYSNYSVGHLLALKVLEQCIEKGISEYDFMQGDEPYKFDWTNKYRQSMNIFCVNKKLSSMMICFGLKASNLTSIGLKVLKTCKNKVLNNMKYA